MAEIPTENIHVLVCEKDGIEPRPLILEQYVDMSSYGAVCQKQQILGNTFGKTRIAKLIFLPEIEE